MALLGLLVTHPASGQVAVAADPSSLEFSLWADAKHRTTASRPACIDNGDSSSGTFTRPRRATGAAQPPEGC